MAKRIFYTRNAIEFYKDSKGNEKYVVSMTLKDIESEISYSTGNHKLISNNKVLFLIWNLPYKITCPYRTPSCTALCYAAKSENLYPDCNPARNKNWAFSKTDNFIPYIIQLVKIKLNNLKKGRKIIFRIHESGDFYNREYVRKWIFIINYFAHDSRIKFVAYTKSIVFFKNIDINGMKNFTLRYSLWADTKADQKAIAENMEMPTYTALSKEDIARLEKNSFFKCECKDCGTCLACFNKNIKRIICEIH